MANLVYNFQRLAWLEAGLRLLDAKTAPERASEPQQSIKTAGKRAFVRPPYFSMPHHAKINRFFEASSCRVARSAGGALRRQDLVEIHTAPRDRKSTRLNSSH